MGRGTAAGLKAAIFGILAFVALFSAASPGFSQTPAQTPAGNTPPAQVREMMQLMQAPEVKQWMATQMAAPSAADSASQNQMSVLSGL
ncbi:mechanosensitive ion channel protein, partial [Rhizobium phaseoli]